MLYMALKYSVKYGRKYFKCFRAEGTPDVFALFKTPSEIWKEFTITFL